MSFTLLKLFEKHLFKESLTQSLFIMKKNLFSLLVFLIFILLPFFNYEAAAQPPPPEPEAIPIDGGLAFLIAAGAAYGARKLYKQQKAKEDIK